MNLDFVIFTGYILPLIYDLFTKYIQPREGFKVPSQGYAQVKGLAFFVVFVCFQAFDRLKLVIHNEVLFDGVFVVDILVATTVSRWFFRSRVKKLKIVYGSEPYVMSDFYKEIVYGFFIALPSVIVFSRDLRVLLRK